MKCENCKELHNGNYGTGRFCTQKCAASYSSTYKREERNKKTSETMKGRASNNKDLKNYQHICENCGNKFERFVRRDRKKHCDKCKRKVVRIRDVSNITSILQLSKRTKTKILKRANMGCSICGWKESTCDIHHIIEVKYNGSDDNDNLIIVCPNHHRLIHDKSLNKYSIEFLLERNLINTFNNWKDFYNKKTIYTVK